MTRHLAAALTVAFLARPTYRAWYAWLTCDNRPIAVCVLAFLWLEFNGGSTDILVLLRNGAKFTLIKAGEWWRLFTSMPCTRRAAPGREQLPLRASAALRNASSAAPGFTIYLLSGLWGAIASALLSIPGRRRGAGAVFLFYFSVFQGICIRWRRFITVVVANLIIGFAAGIDGVAHAGRLVGFLISRPLDSPTRRTSLTIPGCGRRWRSPPSQGSSSVWPVRRALTSRAMRGPAWRLPAGGPAGGDVITWHQPVSLGHHPVG